MFGSFILVTFDLNDVTQIWRYADPLFHHRAFCQKNVLTPQLRDAIYECPLIRDVINAPSSFLQVVKCQRLQRKIALNAAFVHQTNFESIKKMQHGRIKQITIVRVITSKIVNLSSFLTTELSLENNSIQN